MRKSTDSSPLCALSTISSSSSQFSWLWSFCFGMKNRFFCLQFVLEVNSTSSRYSLQINFLEFLKIDVQSPLRIVLILEFFPPNASLLDICKRHPQSTCYRKNEIQCSFKWTWNISKTFCIVIGESIVKKRQNKGFGDVN